MRSICRLESFPPTPFLAPKGGGGFFFLDKTNKTRIIRLVNKALEMNECNEDADADDGDDDEAAQAILIRSHFDWRW